MKKRLLFAVSLIVAGMCGVQKTWQSPDGKFQAILVSEYKLRLCPIADCDQINAEHTFQSKITGVTWAHDAHDCVGVNVHFADGSTTGFLPADIMCSMEHAELYHPSN